MSFFNSCRFLCGIFEYNSLCFFVFRCSIFKVHFAVLFQCSPITIPHLFSFVKCFFKSFLLFLFAPRSVTGQLVYYITSFLSCQPLSSFFLTFSFLYNAMPKIDKLYCEISQTVSEISSFPIPRRFNASTKALALMPAGRPSFLAASARSSVLDSFPDIPIS